MDSDDQEFLTQVTSKPTLPGNYTLLLGHQLNRLMRLAGKPENPSWGEQTWWAVRKDVIGDLIKEIRKN